MQTADDADNSWRGRKTGIRRKASEAFVVLLAAALVVLPDLVGLDRWTPFAQLVAFRPVWAACAFLLGGLIVLSRRLRLVGAGLALVALAGAVIVTPRAWDGNVQAGAGTSANTLAILSANVADSASVQQLAGIIRSKQPDVIILPEASEQYRRRLEKAVQAQDYHGISRRSLTTTVAAMSVLVSPELGDVRFRDVRGTTFPTLTVAGGKLSGTRIVAFHSYPPLPGATGRWRDDLQTLDRWCDKVKQPTIVAGDFNATLDHSALRTAMAGCTDAAAELGTGLRGTWPSSLPWWLTPQIDHVLATPQVQPRQISFYDLKGTDHRALIARVTVP